MKSIIFATALLCALPALAGSIPNSAYTHATIPTAVEKATADKKLIAYLFTEKNSSCGLCEGATKEFVNAVRGKAVLVYLDSNINKEYWYNLPTTLPAALTPGKCIPKLIVTQADGKTIVATLNYDTYEKDPKNTIRDLKKKLH